MTRLDPRSPLVLDTKDLHRRPGSMREIHRSVGAPADLRTPVLAVEEGEPVALDLRLESVLEGVLVTGTVRTTAQGGCVRCLDPVSLPVDVVLQELFAYPDRAVHHQEVGDEELEEEYRLEGDLLDLEPALRDTVVPAFPFQPTCRADCAGLCSQCGARLDDDPDHSHEMLDPRWAALQGLAARPSSGDE